MISNKFKLKLYYEILRIRRIEEKISQKYHEMKMRCPVHLSIGQEAIAVGVSSQLSKNDQIVSNHRSHAHYLAKGGDLKSMLSELYGKKNGCSGGRGGSMNLIDKNVNFILSLPIVGSTIPIGVGLSFEKKINNKNELVIIYLGDAATEQGIFYESLNFAKTNNLKCLFIIENNFYSVYTNLNKRRAFTNLKEIDNIFKIQTYRSNGNKVLDVVNATSNAIKYIKNNSNPAIIILDTFRYLEHCGPNNDDHLNYREEKEIKTWKKNCPLLNFSKILNKEKILNKNRVDFYENKIKKEINNSFKHAENSIFPNSRSVYENIYAK